MTEILRTPRDGCWQITSNIWGQYLAPAVDPMGDVIITTEQFDGFELNDDIPLIPALLWGSWINLCFELTRINNANCEVSCRLLRNVEDPTQYRILIPEQTVSVASVRVNSFDKAIDILTGEVVTQYPPEGWRPCGSSHSHNTMDSFFSGTDDQYELGDPGFHIVVGNINLATTEYTYKASITANKRRFMIDGEKVVDFSAELQPFAKECLAVITMPKGLLSKRTPGALSSFGFSYDWYETVDDFPIMTPGLISDKPLSKDFDLVRAEIDAVMLKVQDLADACKAHRVDASDCLADVAYSIDDMSTESIASSDDPFYWNYA